MRFIYWIEEYLPEIVMSSIVLISIGVLTSFILIVSSTHTEFRNRCEAVGGVAIHGISEDHICVSSDSILLKGE
jgi:hypothetical protein